jgi:hypothetical protein
VQREGQIDTPSGLQASTAVQLFVRTSEEGMLNNKTPVVDTNVMVVKES